MIKQVTEWIKKEVLICEGDTVIVGISGGADSVCLLRVLLELQQTMPFSLSAVHVEHGIRGEASREDAQFVADLCVAYQIPLQTYEVDVPEYAKKKGIGLEEAARILRYDCYQKEVLRHGSAKGTVKVALAHHADDNAETFLFQMVRGSGLDGLSGMQPKREFGERAQIIRPLLVVDRSQIEEYLGEIGQDYRTDETNFDTEYSRNRIRHDILPALQQINTAAVAHINQSAARLRQVSEYLAVEVKKAGKQCCLAMEDGILIKKEEWEKLPELIRSELVCDVLAEASGSSKDIGAVHIDAVQGLFGSQVGRKLNLPYSVVAYRDYEGVWLAKQRKTGEESKLEEEGYLLGEEEKRRLEQGEVLRLELEDGSVTFQIREGMGKVGQIHKKKYTKCFNYDKIRGVLRIRRRKAGDYLTVDSQGHKKKLKEYFINEKIPQKEREAMWLLAEESHIIWVIGGRISTCYKIDEHTKRILEVQVVGGNYYEDQED